MTHKAVTLVVAGAFAVAVAGCATAQRKESPEVGELKNQISTLEAQLQTKDEEIKTLQEQMTSTSQAAGQVEKQEVMGGSTMKFVGQVPAHFTTKQVQVALKNAGYDPGRADGRMGKQTRIAIKAFQKANGLKSDGYVGTKTWNLLGTYLNK